MCSFTQRSQRYCSEDGFSVVSPNSIIKADKLADFHRHIDCIEKHYLILQKKGVPNEDARYILPNACTTDLYLSCNLRELIHIANERLCIKAQWEIRELVKEMVALVHPDLKFMLVPKCKSGRIICNTPCKEE
jgi:thymidylate synthase (FAD)